MAVALISHMAGFLGMHRDTAWLSVALAAAAVFATVALPLVTVTHSFSAIGSPSSVQIECGWLSSRSNTGAHARGVGSCGALIRTINTDDADTYLVVPSGVARQSEAIDYVTLLTLPFLVVGLIAPLINKPLAKIAADTAIVVAAGGGVLLVNLALGLRRSLHAAPDPGAVATSSLGLSVLLLTGVPLVVLSRPLHERGD